MTALHPGKKRANANTVPMAHASATDHAADRASAQRLVSAQDADADAAALEGAAYTDDVPPPTKRARRTHDDHDDGPEGVDGYFAERERIVSRERDIGFDGRCRRRASPLEHRVEGILARLRLRDAATVYEAAPRTTGHAGQTHRRFAGDHFLGNVDLIGHTALFDVARMMPKGAHLHVHFNACLDPRVLLGMAAGMERMCITSDVALLDGSAFDRCEIRFGICCPDKEDPGDIFSADYRPRQTMRFSDFRARFSEFYPGEEGVDDWLVSKVVFHEGEAHHARQTAVGAWERFNARTRMMKGLFNYETAFRRYTRLCLADFARDGIQYAEIRPNFMASNQLLSDDGTALIDNWGMMERIIDEAMRFVADEDAAGRFFGGVKVIYCTPRSFSRAQVKAALDECLQFKLKWPRWIAGRLSSGDTARVSETG